MHEIVKKLLVALLVTQNCNGYASSRQTISSGVFLKRNGRFLWSQLEGSGVVPVEVNVQDTVTELATGMMQVWSNAQEWWQEIQSNNPNRPNKKPTTSRPTIPEYLYEEEIPIVTNKVSMKNKLKKKRGQSKINYKKKNPILSVLPDNKEYQSQQNHKADVIVSAQNSSNVDISDSEKNKDKEEKKPMSKKKKKSKKHKKITKVIDYRNYYYFFMGLLGLWPQF